MTMRSCRRARRVIVSVSRSSENALRSAFVETPIQPDVYSPFVLHVAGSAATSFHEFAQVEASSSATADDTCASASRSHMTSLPSSADVVPHPLLPVGIAQSGAWLHAGDHAGYEV